MELSPLSIGLAVAFGAAVFVALVLGLGLFLWAVSLTGTEETGP